MRPRTLDGCFRDNENRNEMHSMRGWIQGLGGSVVVTGGVVAAALAALAFVAFHAAGTSRSVTGKVGKVSVGTPQSRRGTARAAALVSAAGGASASGPAPTRSHRGGSPGGGRRVATHVFRGRGGG